MGLIMGTKTRHKNLDGSYEITDTRTLHEAQQENLNHLKEITTNLILAAGYDEIWQRNVAMEIISQEQAQAGTSYIAACRNEYLRCKALILAATSNEAADSVQFIAPTIPENL